MEMPCVLCFAVLGLSGLGTYVGIRCGFSGKNGSLMRLILGSTFLTRGSFSPDVIQVTQREKMTPHGGTLIVIDAQQQQHCSTLLNNKIMA